MKNLIVNADDLGWTAGVNRGIAQAHRSGIVTSSSLLANGGAFDDGVKVARVLPALGVGVHLNLSDGAPVAGSKAVPSLVDERGELSSGPEQLLLKLARRKLKLSDVEREWDAQIERIRAAGIAPTHLDGHKHVHMLPGLFPIALKLAKKHSIAAIRISNEASPLRTALSCKNGGNSRIELKQGVQARGLKLLARDARKLADKAGIESADYFCGIAQTGVLTREGVLNLLESLPEGTTELMCHPGYLDEDLAASDTRLQNSRAAELEILTDITVRKSVASHGIRLINYNQFAN
ncbi:MAG TPA: ChbG/HpnK family deacetylase [Candidatus Sulfotelmatobacter sp.]|jgi:hopanoid biosynthesis associated protein HpnK|nr:ChbG/HpnK family deacetylase [Candidatus Sulfotelmatobacter sp.]